MNLRKLSLVGPLALALVAFALPATASAEPDPNGVFLDDHEVINHEGDPVTGTFTGTAQFVISVAPTEGVHCTELEIGINFWETHGIVESFESDHCTTLSADPKKAGFPIDPVMEGTWTVDPNYVTDEITITDVHITNTVTHPLTPHLVVSESTLNVPTVHATIDGDTDTIHTIDSLTGTGATVEIPPGSGVPLGIPISGHLTQHDTTIGLAPDTP